MDIPHHADIMKARELSDEARMWIDDEVNLCNKICNTYKEEVGCEYDKLFSKERGMFITESYRSIGSLYMLPLCFYLPPAGEATHPTQDELFQADRKAGWLWGAEDHMGSVYDCDWSLPKYDYNKLFHKFKHSLASFFTNECMHDTAHQLAYSDGVIDAFRVAMRKIFFRAPSSRDCLWYTLEKADELAAREEGDEGDY